MCVRLLDRRKFFGQMLGGLAVTAAVRTWPFRVYSFPTEIVIPEMSSPLFEQISYTELADLRDDILVDNFFADTAWLKKLRQKGLGIDDFAWDRSPQCDS